MLFPTIFHCDVFKWSTHKIPWFNFKSQIHRTKVHSVTRSHPCCYYQH